MDRVWQIICCALVSVGMVAPLAGVQAQQVTGAEIERLDSRLAIASKHYGDDTVQLHSFTKTEDGGVHEVHTFNCANQTYRQDYSGATAPESFGSAATQGDSAALANQLANDTEQAAMASHACGEHGFPSLNLEW